MKQTSLFVSAIILGLIVCPPVVYADISRTLQLGSRGQDVRELQQFLNSDSDTRIALSGVGSSGHESDYFGTLTLLAVKKLQTKYAYEVLVPAGLSVPTGTVGGYTRALIYRLKNLQPAPTTPGSQTAGAPTITSVYPTTITTNGQTLTITGQNLTGATLMTSSATEAGIPLVATSDGKSATIQFTYPAIEKIQIQLAPYRGTTRYRQVIAALLQNMNGQEIQKSNGTTLARVILFVKNNQGQSATKTISVDLGQALAN